MANFYAPMPQYEAPRNALDFTPLNQGIAAVGDMWKDNRKKDQFANALAQAQGIVDPRLMGMAETLGPEHGPNALFQAYNAEQQRKMTAQQMAETRRMHDQTLALQQQVENRNAALLPYQIASARAGAATAGIDAQIKQRELDAPKDTLQKLKEDERLVKVDPRTGAMQEVVSPSNDSGYKSLKERVDVEHNIRKEYTALAKPFIEVRDAYNRVETAARTPSAASDMSLIFGFMKILDPGSVVREGEFATAQNAAGVPDRITNLYNRLISGERLNPAQRQDFVNQARQLYTTQAEQHQKLGEEYASIARSAKLDPSRVGINLNKAAKSAAEPAAASAAPAQPPRYEIGYSKETEQFQAMNPATGEWVPIPGAQDQQQAEKMAIGVLRGAAPQPAAPASPAPQADAAAPAIPDGAVRLLKTRPSMAAAFDAKYGPGAAARILKGG